MVQRREPGLEIVETERESMHFVCSMQLPPSINIDELLLNANTVYLRLQVSSPSQSSHDYRMVSLLT